MSLILAPDAAGRASAARAPESADVVVVGAGPAGSAAAAHLGAAGLDVLVLERTPDTTSTGTVTLVPAAVRELRALGIGETVTAQWHRTTGVRFVGGGMRLALAWPDAGGRPGLGLTTSRAALARTLASYAVSRGARLRRGTEVTGFTTTADGRVDGVTVRDAGIERSIGARLVIDASGMATAASAGGAVAASADFASPRHTDDHVESWLSLTSADGAQLPGHGWVVGRGDGHVTVGVGALADDTTATAEACAGVLQQWLTALPAGWRLTADTMTGPVTGSRLGSDRRRGRGAPAGVLRVGDAAGAAHPVTGEGITGALVCARTAATVVLDALAHDLADEREATLAAYDSCVDSALARHEKVGRVAARLLDNRGVTRLATTYALPRESLMRHALTHVIAPPGTAVQTSVTAFTMGHVTRAATHPGTERGVDQR